MTLEQFFAELIKKLGFSVTPWRVAFFVEWARHEGMPFDRTWNPLATTRASENVQLSSVNIGFGSGNWNSVPVRIYASPADGIQATYETLVLSYYPNIRAMLRDQTGYDEAVSDFVTYVGSVSYGKHLIEYAKNLKASKEPGNVSLTKEQEARVMELVEFFVKTTFPLYWEALWKRGFTNYPNPTRPWEDEAGDEIETGEDVLKAIRDYLNESLP